MAELLPFDTLSWPVFWGMGQICVLPFLRDEWTKLHKIWGGHRKLTALYEVIVLDFRYIAPFRNSGDSKGTEAKFGLFYRVKIGEGWAEIRSQFFKL